MPAITAIAASPDASVRWFRFEAGFIAADERAAARTPPFRTYKERGEGITLPLYLCSKIQMRSSLKIACRLRLT